MPSKIPSWAVAVAGATIVLVATATSSTILYQKQKEIEEATLSVASERRKIDHLWNNHLLADHRSGVADSLFGQALNSSQVATRDFLLQQVGYYLRGSSLAMTAAAGIQVNNETPETVANVEHAFHADGDYQEAFKKFKKMINDLRLKSQSYIGEKSQKIYNLQVQIDALHRQKAILYLAVVFFNLLGLIVVMCKDLPVWRVSR
jgi:hypothetical protein